MIVYQLFIYLYKIGVKKAKVDSFFVFLLKFYRLIL
ncbi:hypothetical protein CLU83_0501 [Flavobacterium sp. 1]|nr:hypothetical protein CLU83_0501 [Flavobacterium sp. 1]